MKEKKQKQTAEVAAETQTAKSGKKSFLQLILFIALSLAGFVVQMVIEQVGGRIDAIKNLQINGTTDFDFFGIPNTYGAFIVSLVAIFICKVINFILHRKVLFKPRRNLAFGIAMYVTKRFDELVFLDRSYQIRSGRLGVDLGCYGIFYC